MSTEIAVVLISSITAILIAILNHLFTSSKNKAEIEKLQVETENSRKTIQSSYTNTVKNNTLQENELVVYNSAQHITRMDFEDFSTRSLGYEIQQGVIVIRDEETGLKLCNYSYNGKEFNLIAKNELVAGERKFHISCELKSIKATYSVIIFLWDYLEEEDSIDDRGIMVSDNAWKKYDTFFRVPPDQNYHVHLLATRTSGNGSLQIRNFTVSELIS